MNQIVPDKLFQCCYREAQDVANSRNRAATIGLHSILTVADNIKIAVPAHILHFHIPVDEMKDVPAEYFDLACKLDFYPMIVHCVAGANRSRVFAAAIAHKVFGLPIEEAIRRADPPTSGFVYDSFRKWAQS